MIFSSEIYASFDEKKSEKKTLKDILTKATDKLIFREEFFGFLMFFNLYSHPRKKYKKFSSLLMTIKAHINLAIKVVEVTGSVGRRFFNGFPCGRILRGLRVIKRLK